MLLVLLRHADAGSPDPSRWPGDADRPLTDAGRAVQQRMSELLRRSGLKLDSIFTSPLLRARQTAQIVAEAFDLGTPTTCEGLAAEPDLAAIARCIGDADATRTIGLTGHSPWLDQFASWLLAGSPEDMRIDFPKSAAMVIRADKVAAGAGLLVAFVHPEFADV